MEYVILIVVILVAIERYYANKLSYKIKIIREEKKKADMMVSVVYLSEESLRILSNTAMKLGYERLDSYRELSPGCFFWEMYFDIFEIYCFDDNHKNIFQNKINELYEYETEEYVL